MRLTFVTVNDDTLAETRAANEQMAAAMANVRMEDVPPAKVRAARESGRSAFPLPVADPRAETPTITGPAGDIPLRIIRAAQPDGVFLHIHGGGFTYGSPREYDDFLRVIVDRMNLTVVSVDYRLAPEHPFPAGADDFIQACRRDWGLAIEGLMCIPPEAEPPGLHFALLARIAARNGLSALSMGMSGDFETAIRFGATSVRVGSALFGGRAPGQAALSGSGPT